ncbi:CHAT domain-containing protein [Dokdonella sp.]|uniref:CHAT domain-containing protein n=1 Tax=Dokdonella sp. TaxID=2291710 RepID=UPI0025C03D17|nr:CHAT domain-containing protein [Dokdonella sp.]MBX3692294.1 CHAT domain-containing protein [Dokdonella sp.]
MTGAIAKTMQRQRRRAWLAALVLVACTGATGARGGEVDVPTSAPAGTTPAESAAAYVERAEQHWREQRPEAVIDDAAKALAAIGTRDADAPLRLRALRVRGLAEAELRQSAAALATLDEARRLSAMHDGADSPAHAEVLGELSVAQRVAGDYGAAITTLETAIAIQRRHDDPAALALALLRLGQAQRISGDLVRAEANYREALELDARTPDPGGRRRADLLYALGNLERHRERPEAAIAWYAQAVPAFERAYGGDSLKLARVLNNYGNAESVRIGRHAEAIALFERALAIVRKDPAANPGDHYPRANIAMVDIWNGRHREAEAGFREMLARLDGMPPTSEASPLFVQHGLAAALWGQRRFDDAFAAAEASEHTRVAGLREVSASFSDAQMLVFQEQEYATLDLALAIAVASGRGDLLERAWSLAIAARGQVTAIQSERLGRVRARLDSDPAIAPLWQAWLAASSALENARLAGVAAAGASERREAAERRLVQALPRGATIAGMQPDLAAVRAALPDDSALVWLNVGAHVRAEDFASREMHERDPFVRAFVLEAGTGTPIRVVPLGPLRPLMADVERWQAALATPQGDEAILRQHGRRVTDALWRPLAAATKARRMLMLADAPLQRIAWSALPDGEGYLLDGERLVHLLNHEEELLAPVTSASLPPRYSVVALADPLDREGVSRAGCAARREVLPGARREVERVQALVEVHTAAPMLALLGEAATESAFRRAAPQAAILHLATHGSDGSGRDCVAGTRGVSLAGDPATAADSAAVATALVLAAHARVPDAADDGLLGYLEIAALDLRGVRWAVLAACTTAAGAMRHYEGLDGLARAFRIAGARTVFVSLWPVDDGATATWSEALYAARLGARADVPHALRDAQRKVIATRKAAGRSMHPFYWAGFIALGDWR